jgi:heme A synthase
VKKELPAEIVAAHLATAMAFMGVMIVTLAVSMFRARRIEPFAAALESAYTRLAILTAGAAFVTLVLGSYISGTKASLACSGWPLCNGSVFPGGSSDVGLHVLHRFVAGLLGLMLLGLTYQAFEERRRQPLLVGLTLFASTVYVAQALVGAANIWTDLSAGVVVTHLSLAALLWCVMVTLSVLAFYAPEPDAASDELRRETAKVAEWAR